jgi:hypothetical protein
MDLRETEWGGIGWILLAHDRDHWQAPVDTVSREKIGASTSHNPTGLHGLLHGYIYFLLLQISI